MQGISLLPDSYEESDGYDSDGIPNFRDQWKELLAGYPSLGKDFENLAQLHSQKLQFVKWSRKKTEPQWGKKRKRQSDGGDTGEKDRRAEVEADD